MRNPQLLEKLHEIKKSRIKLDVLDLTRIQNVSDFWIELDKMIEMNFEKPTTKKKALYSGLTFDVILPESVSEPMHIEVLFDGEGVIEMVNFDPWNGFHYIFCNMLERSKIRRHVELGLILLDF